jgi:hypothetical protein
MKKCQANFEACQVYALARAMSSSFLNFSDDERTLATYTCSIWSYFDESLSWNMARNAFRDDLLRWKVAFDGLCRAGWLTHDRYLGYKPSYLASLVQPISASVSHDKLFMKYIFHFAGEMIRLNDLADQCPSAAEYFCDHNHHFSHVLAIMFSKMETVRETTAGDSANYGLFGTLSDTLSQPTANVVDVASDATTSYKSSPDSLHVTKAVSTDVEAKKVQRSLLSSLKKLFGRSKTDKKVALTVDPRDTRVPRVAGTAEAANVSRRENASAGGVHGGGDLKATVKPLKDNSYLQEIELYQRPHEISEHFKHMARFISPYEIIDSQHYHYKKARPELALPVFELLAGRLSSLLKCIVSLPTGVYILGRILDCLRSARSSKVNDALIDYADLEHLLDNGMAAVHYLKPLVSSIAELNITKGVPAYAARAMLVHGKVLEAAGDPAGAKLSYATSIKLYLRAGATEETSWQYASAVSRHNACHTALLSLLLL